jgi:uncharacterized Zn-binding protein involved in type VI secretion
VASVGDRKKEKGAQGAPGNGSGGGPSAARNNAGPAPGGGQPPPGPTQPSPPADLKKIIARGVRVAEKGSDPIQSLAEITAEMDSALGMAADPGAALANYLGGAADKAMDSLVSGLAAKIDPRPAATMGSTALGAPHAHTKHPPSGPNPIPVPVPIPFPPLGPVMVGLCVTVLVNGKPTARCGDYGFNPSCCGIAPPLSAMFQIVTGSSNVYIGGARAARANLDITAHCFNVPAPKITINAAKLAAVQSVVRNVTGAIGAVKRVVGAVNNAVATINEVTQTVSDFVEAVANDDAAMAAAIAQDVALRAAQAAADKIAAKLTRQMGTDLPMLPPMGTPGLMLDGSPDVLIGGFPLPSFSAIAQGLMKRIAGVQFTSGGGADVGCPSCG